MYQEVSPLKKIAGIVFLVLGLAIIILGITLLRDGLMVGLGCGIGVLAMACGVLSMSSNKSRARIGIVGGAVSIMGIAALLCIHFFVITPKNNSDAMKNKETAQSDVKSDDSWYNLAPLQRDTQRKNDVSRLATAVIVSASANRGTPPDASYLQTTQLEDLGIIDNVTGDADPTTTTALYKKGTDCNGDSQIRSYSVSVLLEDGTTYCKGSNSDD